MLPEYTPSLTRDEWARIQQDLAVARRDVAVAPAGISRQPRFDRLQSMERRASDFINGWLAAAFEMEQVVDPRMVLSLDVDGVLEDEALGFSMTGPSGAAALKLLQLGGVAVLLNTARSIQEVGARCKFFQLLGGVGQFGGVVLDSVFQREELLISPAAKTQVSTLRAALRSDPTIVIDSEHDASLRVSRIVDGVAAPIVGAAAQLLLTQLGLHQLTFWVAPRHTDFVDRTVDKGSGIERLRSLLGLRSLPLAAMGDAACDLPMLRLARHAFVPAATLPTYSPPRGQRLVRARKVGDASVWEAACQLVPDSSLQREVVSRSEALEIPAWLSESLRRRPVDHRHAFPRIAAAFSAMTSTTHRSARKRREDD